MGCVRVCRIHHRLVLSEAEGRVEWIPRFASLTRDDTRGRSEIPKSEPAGGCETWLKPDPHLSPKGATDI